MATTKGHEMDKPKAGLRGIGDGGSGWLWQLVEETDRGPKVIINLGSDYKAALAVSPAVCRDLGYHFAYGD